MNAVVCGHESFAFCVCNLHAFLLTRYARLSPPRFRFPLSLFCAILHSPSFVFSTFLWFDPLAFLVFIQFPAMFLQLSIVFSQNVPFSHLRSNFRSFSGSILVSIPWNFLFPCHGTKSSLHFLSLPHLLSLFPCLVCPIEARSPLFPSSLLPTIHALSLFRITFEHYYS